MQPFSKISALAAPLPLNDVDTDLIIPAQFLTSVSREGYGENLFTGLRQSNPDLALNRPEFAAARILVAASNFGCGSSREHAVWALMGAGFRAVIAKSFADIFASNSAKNGLLLVTLADDAVDTLLAEADSGQCMLEVDLEQQTVTASGERRYSFEYDPFRKHCLLNGLDDIDYILAHKEKIDEFRRQNDARRFFSTV